MQILVWIISNWKKQKTYQNLQIFLCQNKSDLSILASQLYTQLVWIMILLALAVIQPCPVLCDVYLIKLPEVLINYSNRYVKREVAETKAEAKLELEPGKKLDLGFKEGQTIRINIQVSKLCLTTAIQNLKLVKSTHICLIWLIAHNFSSQKLKFDMIKKYWKRVVFSSLTLTMLKYFCINHKDQRF